jgi:cytochrome c peroxidase
MGLTRGVLTMIGVGAAGSFILGALSAAAPQRAAGDPQVADDMAALTASYRRPEMVPFPADNPYTPAKAELGRALFFDPQLSAGGGIACASCHIPELGWEDGRKTGIGEPGTPLDRHTPTLWNLAWGEFFFWDGRADSLEAQASMPIQSHVEMNMPMQVLVARLAETAAYRDAFAAAFPEDPRVNENNLLNALATYERTLVSPETRFDRRIAGEKSLSKAEERGFVLFNGKANCAACHSGWAFTDHAFHDIGLPGDDRRRGKVLDLKGADHAFKTPTLRDIGRRAPYMHDGSLPTLAAVIEHYETGIVERPTLSADLERISLTPEERADLLAFLGTLTAPGDVDTAPQVTPAPVQAQLAEAVPTPAVSQRDKAFTPKHIEIDTGATVRILNDDSRTHNIRIHDANLQYNSGAQEPGETIEITFEMAGRYYAFCAIHPKMELIVDVEPDAVDHSRHRLGEQEATPSPDP